MRRVLRRAALILAVVLVALGLWVRFLAGRPVLPGVPGGPLRGEPASELPADWMFANRDDYLLVESRAGTLPYSASVWFLAHDGRLHLLLPSFFGDGLQRRLAGDPHLRVAFDGKLYEQVAVRVTDDTAIGALLAPVMRRQFAIEIGAGARALGAAAPEGVEMAVFRLEDPQSP